MMIGEDDTFYRNIKNRDKPFREQTNQQLAAELRVAIAQAEQRQKETQVGIDRMKATLTRLENKK